MASEIPPAAPGFPFGETIPVNVHFDEMDAFGTLHNARYPLLVERAWIRMWQGLDPDGDWEMPAETCYVVKELRIDYQKPVRRPGAYVVHFWLERLGNTSLTYGFRLCAMDGSVTYALGTRVLVHLDPQAREPAPLAERFKGVARRLMRPMV
ncbi:acyl-CoA thioesterase [Streptomyces sp. 4F14]|uniref:acyl-CoA thioesterase n=1 Tax=Streptomyces sp. 4F14 TaxID=3394380 RepID=UPI003A8622C3